MTTASTQASTSSPSPSPDSAVSPNLTATDQEVGQAPMRLRRRPCLLIGGEACLDNTVGVHAISLRQLCRGRFICIEGGESEMPRPTPHTAATVEGISDGYRMAVRIVSRDGVIDADESDLLRQFRHMQALALRADWSRRARQAVENGGRLNRELERESRELEREYPLELA